jgi:predicted nicotinamide N-methyase
VLPEEVAKRIFSMTRQHSVLGLKFRLITPAHPLYHATPEGLAELPSELHEPWWGFCWPGSYVLGHYLLQHPEVVRHKRVLDIATGCGVSALAALRAGAAGVVANDIDPWAAAATLCNLAESKYIVGQHSARLVTNVTNLLSSLHDPPEVHTADVILLGDICYDSELAVLVCGWLDRVLSRPGGEPLVLIGDPGRHGFAEIFGGLRASDGRSEAIGGRLALERVHSVGLPALVADTSHGLVTADVWRVRRSQKE